MQSKRKSGPFRSRKPHLLRRLAFVVGNGTERDDNTVLGMYGEIQTSPEEDSRKWPYLPVGDRNIVEHLFVLTAKLLPTEDSLWQSTGWRKISELACRDDPEYVPSMGRLRDIRSPSQDLLDKERNTDRAISDPWRNAATNLFRYRQRRGKSCLAFEPQKSFEVLHSCGRETLRRSLVAISPAVQ